MPADGDTPVDTPPAAPPATPEAPPDTSPDAPSRRRALVVAGVCVALLVGLGVWALTRPPAAPVTALTAPSTSRSLEPVVKFPDRTDPLPAPPFVVTALNTTPGIPAGAPIDLAAFRGRPVVLNFWASWCGPCRREMPAFSELAERYGDRVAFVGVATQDRETPARAFADEVDVTYPLGFDEGDVLTDSYGVFGLPSTYFVDADGTIVDARFGELSVAQMTERIDSLFGVAAP